MKRALEWGWIVYRQNVRLAILGLASVSAGLLAYVVLTPDRGGHLPLSENDLSSGTLYLASFYYLIATGQCFAVFGLLWSLWPLRSAPSRELPDRLGELLVRVGPRLSLVLIASSLAIGLKDTLSASRFLELPGEGVTFGIPRLLDFQNGASAAILGITAWIGFRSLRTSTRKEEKRVSTVSAAASGEPTPPQWWLPVFPWLANAALLAGCLYGLTHGNPTDMDFHHDIPVVAMTYLGLVVLSFALAHVGIRLDAGTLSFGDRSLLTILELLAACLLLWIVGHAVPFPGLWCRPGSSMAAYEQEFHPAGLWCNGFAGLLQNGVFLAVCLAGARTLGRSASEPPAGPVSRASRGPWGKGLVVVAWLLVVLTGLQMFHTSLVPGLMSLALAIGDPAREPLLLSHATITALELWATASLCLEACLVFKGFFDFGLGRESPRLGADARLRGTLTLGAFLCALAIARTLLLLFGRA